MGEEAYRQTGAFYAKCAELRTLLAAEGALHPGRGLAGGGVS
jgi:hypothetical protein